jgi:hypothetical protein
VAEEDPERLREPRANLRGEHDRGYVRARRGHVFLGGYQSRRAGVLAEEKEHISSADPVVVATIVARPYWSNQRLGADQVGF